MKTLLAIETSCDETAVCILQEDKTILAHHVQSQIEQHLPYGGVVPEIASRHHLEALAPMIHNVLLESNLSFKNIDAFASTGGPGLIGGVIIGVMMAKTLSFTHKKPFLAINHLEGHALTVRLSHNVSFPYLLLLISGGHCQFVAVKALGDYHILGRTIDDALGEAFDKVAKMLGLGYPGGPIVESLAKNGDPERFSYPKPLYKKLGCDFSFSGLKTAVKRSVDQLEKITEQDKADICASFQQCVIDIILDRFLHAYETFQLMCPDSNQFVLAGGVASNQSIFQSLQTALSPIKMIVPPPALCTDNAAMIGWAAMEHYLTNKQSALDFAPRARWSLEDALSGFVPLS